MNIEENMDHSIEEVGVDMVQKKEWRNTLIWLKRLGGIRHLLIWVEVELLHASF